LTCSEHPKSCWIRSNAVQGLRELAFRDDHAVCSRLFALCKDGSWAVRMKAVEALGDLVGPVHKEEFPPIVSALRNDVNIATRLAAEAAESKVNRKFKATDVPLADLELSDTSSDAGISSSMDQQSHFAGVANSALNTLEELHNENASNGCTTATVISSSALAMAFAVLASKVWQLSARRTY